MKKIIVGISGADGVVLGLRLLELLHSMPEVETYLVISRAAEVNLKIECGCSPDRLRSLADCCYDIEDMTAPIASGSFRTDGMVVSPCSMKTLSAIACGYADNLLTRAADVCLKERRRVVLLPREMPLGRIHLKNLLAADELGCTIVPPMLTFYNAPQSIDDQIIHILGKTMMQFDLTVPGFRSWEGVNA